MKTVIAILLLTIAQATFSQEIIQLPFQHPKLNFYIGQYNFDNYMKLTCALQLEELLEMNEKYGYAAGTQSATMSNLDQKRYTPEAEILMTEAAETMEIYRRSFWEERSHKDFLFRRSCHAHKNPDQKELNLAADKKASDKARAQEEKEAN